MRVDVVDEREDVLVVAVVVLERELDADAVALRLDVHDLGVQRLPAGVEELHHLLETALRMEGLLLLLSLALVVERNGHALVEERELAQTGGERRVVVAQLGEDLVVGLEPDLGAALARARLAEHLELGRGGAAREVHVVLFPVALDPHLELLGKRVHDGHADAVQTAGDLVAVLVELSAGVEHGHRELDARDLLRRVNVDRNAASVVVDGHRVVGVNRDVDLVGVSGQRLVDGVVDDLVNEVVQPARGGRSDVHAGAFANGLEPLEYLNVASVVFRLFSSLRHVHPESGRTDYPNTRRKRAAREPRKITKGRSESKILAFV